VGIDAGGVRCLAGTDLVDDVEVARDPAPRLLRFQEGEIELELDAVVPDGALTVGSIFTLGARTNAQRGWAA
jgi:hypothetical protein